MNRPTVFLAGADIGSRTVWSWQWDDGSPPQHHVVEAPLAAELLDRLSRALPDPIAEVDQPAEDDDAAVDRCLSGALSQRESEICLARGLAQVFLPEDLSREIEGHCAGDAVGVLRVLPPPSSYAVPWELLPLHHGDCDADGQRLIEKMDFLQVAPPLTRDGTGTSPAPWEDGEGLRVIDPRHRSPDRQVMARIEGSPEFRHDFQHAQLYQWPAGDFSQRITADALSERLEAGPSRMLWVGHAATIADDFGTAALELGDEKLSAAMIFTGANDPKSPGGRRRWPMPARVGLVACRSGVDHSHPEPFGLVVACLEAGAQLVTATRWTLPTDFAFLKNAKQRESGIDEKVFLKNGPFNAAAHAVDEIHQHHDPMHPIHALGEWQRNRLQAWRSSGAVTDSPIIWASIANYHAPERTVEHHGNKM